MVNVWYSRGYGYLREMVSAYRVDLGEWGRTGRVYRVFPWPDECYHSTAGNKDNIEYILVNTQAMYVRCHVDEPWTDLHLLRRYESIRSLFPQGCI